MAGETFYFFFSIVAVLAATLYIANMVTFRIKGENILGEKVKPGTLDYKKIRRLASAHALIPVVILEFIFLVNLSYDVIRLIQMNTSDARVLLIFAPIVAILIFCWVAHDVRQKFRQ
jgi:hypothetical protein